MKIVVVDDSPEIVEVVSICLQLRWNDAVLFSASTGRKGIELVKTNEPDAVILDVNLPDIDGFQVLQEVRLFSKVPVVMLTVKGKDVASRIPGTGDWTLKRHCRKSPLHRLLPLPSKSLYQSCLTL